MQGLTLISNRVAKENVQVTRLAAESVDPEEDKTRKLAELRITLEKRVNELQAELNQLKALLDFVNSTLLDKSFKKPEIKAYAPPAPISEAPIQPSQPASKPVETATPSLGQIPAIPIKTVTGDMLAELYADDENMHVVLAKDKQFTADTPPFTAFLVQRVLAKMQEKDRESASHGDIPPDRILFYEIVKDGDVIREINVANIGADRARELKSSLRWTLEKMYEKMKATP
jgi:hypothetical protein